jgi:hypothetical protein
MFVCWTYVAKGDMCAQGNIFLPLISESSILGLLLPCQSPNSCSQLTAADETYGQNFMCVTMEAGMFDIVASLEMINRPYIYDSLISTSMTAALPNFATWVKGGKSTLTSSSAVLKSCAGKSFTMFAKSSAWGKDLYDDFVAPTISKYAHYRVHLYKLLRLLRVRTLTEYACLTA